MLALLHLYYITHYFPVSSRKPYFKLHYLAIGIFVTYKVRQWSHKPAVDQGNIHTNPTFNPEGTEHRRIIVKTSQAVSPELFSMSNAQNVLYVEAYFEKSAQNLVTLHANLVNADVAMKKREKQQE